ARHLVFDMVEQRHDLVAQALPLRATAPARAVGAGSGRFVPVVMWIRTHHDNSRQALAGVCTAPSRDNGFARAYSPVFMVNIALTAPANCEICSLGLPRPAHFP